MESFNNFKRRKPRKFSISPRLKKLKEDFIKNGGKFEKYEIGNLFEIKTPSKKFNANTLKFGGKYPYVVRTSQNNGIRNYIDEDIKYLNPANTISFGQDTATIFYQEQPYFTGDKIKILSFKHKKLEQKTACFLLSVMNKSFSSFLWGQASFNVEILKKVKILLPTTNNKIDVQYMENYISELEEERISELEEERISELTAYLKVSGLEDYKLTKDEQESIDKINNKKVKFEKFSINEIFDIATGRDFIIGNTEKGDIPLISHTNENNGLVANIKEVNNRRIFDAKKTIALADRGVFYATTQNKNFHIGTRVKALTFKEGVKSEEERLFVTSSINKLQLLFTDYLTNATDKLPNLQIELPTTNNKIDYGFMKTYIKAIEKLVIKNVVEWRDKQINATKQVVNNV